MFKGSKILAVIPARGGSKGIPKKNIRKVNGRPLIDYTISEALKSNYLDKVLVSTDSEEIAEAAKNCGADVPFLRSEKLATDEARTIDVLLETVARLKQQEEEYDYLVLLQPTQPRRTVQHIDEAIEKMLEEGYDSLASVSEVEEHPVLMRKITEDNKLESILPEQSTIRRQDFKPYYLVNGAIYINKLDENFNQSTSLNDNKYPYIMEKKYDIDIDEPIDLEWFEWILNREKNE